MEKKGRRVIDGRRRKKLRKVRKITIHSETIERRNEKLVR
jgi:hypothetical protein